MLVQGDRSRTVRPQGQLRALTAVLRAAEEAPHGRARHDHLTDAFIRAGDLAQGVADADFEREGFDHRSPAQDAAIGLLLALARKLAASLGSGFVAAGPPVAPELMALALTRLPETITISTPAAYVFEAVYPEAYLRTAAGYPWGAPPLVIGLRGVGTGLAALVAAVTGARTVLTLRPSPDARVADELRAVMSGHVGPFAIVGDTPDGCEAIAVLLKGLGVDSERLVFLGCKPAGAGSAIKAPVATFAQMLDDDPIDGWFVDLTGDVSRVEDLSAGAWRGARITDPADWPPADPARERLKFRLDTAAGSLLAKFAGLGEMGEAKLARAEALHRAGFTVEPLGLRRGFLVERWEAGGGATIERGALVERLGRYLAFRCASFPAQPEDGADMAALKTMARLNAAELLGDNAARGISARMDALRPSGPPRPIHVDGRLHAWEWISTPDGLLLKTDAVDHSEGPDLIGCQDVAWDIAGATVEFDLVPDEVGAIVAAVRTGGGHEVDADRLRLMDIAYPAFQAGLWTQALSGSGDDERPRLAAQVARYVERLKGFAG